MAVIFLASADYADLGLWTNTPYVTISTDYARTGAASYRFPHASSWMSQTFDSAYTELYWRLAVYQELRNPQMNFRFQNGSSAITTIQLLAGILNVYRGSQYGTLLGAVADSFNNWNCYEIYAKQSATIGIVQVKVNGILVVNLTGINTGASPYTGILAQVHSGDPCYLDDILVETSQWPGLGGVEVVRPNADGNYTGWSSGNYSNVADDSDATYVANDAETAAKDSYEIPALASDRHTPTCVGLATRAQLSGAGSGTLRPFFRSGSVDTPGNSAALNTQLTTQLNIQTTYPDEVGLEVVA